MADRSPIAWSAMSENGADGIGATPDTIIVVGSEVISAFDRATGEVRWTSEMSDTAGPTPLVITADGLVVVAPPWEPVQAFDLATGSEQAVPPNTDTPEITPTPRMPDGYSFDSNGLTFNHSIIWWSEHTRSEPYVARLGRLTIINDFDNGLRVVDDSGALLAAPPLGPRHYDAVPVFIADDIAVVVAPDGVLYVVGETGSGDRRAQSR